MPQLNDISDAELLGYADELLPASRAAEVEESLRDQEPLRRRTAQLLRDRDDGTHTVADIWRRHRISCPNRLILGEYLLGTLDNAVARAVTLHVYDVGCRFCRADLDDLLAAREDVNSHQRRQKFFESSVGHRPQDDST